MRPSIFAVIIALASVVLSIVCLYCLKHPYEVNQGFYSDLGYIMIASIGLMLSSLIMSIKQVGIVKSLVIPLLAWLITLALQIHLGSVAESVNRLLPNLLCFAPLIGGAATLIYTSLAKRKDSVHQAT